MSKARPTVPAIAVAVLAVALAGCLGVLDDSTDELEEADDPSVPRSGTEPDGNGSQGRTDDGSAAPVVLTEPRELTGEEGGFEPSIEVGADGTVYVTAAPTQRPGPGDQLASWLWYSEDSGETWAPLPSPGQVHERFPGLEGDVAVDDEGRLYFADVNLADTSLHRWAPGPAWDLSRPLATTTPLDDRPWLAAHGDGIVYLVVRGGVELDAPEALGGEAIVRSRTLFVSEDGGLTWTSTQLSNGWCQLVASPADDETVMVACQDGEGAGSTGTVLLSRNRGAGIEEVHSVELERGAVFLVPGAAIDASGNLYAAFLDDRVERAGGEDPAWQGSAPGRVRYAVSTDGGETWTEHEVTPFEARFSTMHASAGRSGTLALTFYATEDLEPDEETNWYPYLMVSADADSSDPAWTTVRLLDEPAGTGSSPPRDFFQNDVGPDNAAHVALQRNIPPDAMRDGPARGIPADVLYVRQAAGPNLRG